MPSGQSGNILAMAADPGGGQPDRPRTRTAASPRPL